MIEVLPLFSPVKLIYLKWARISFKAIKHCRKHLRLILRLIPYETGGFFPFNTPSFIILFNTLQYRKFWLNTYYTEVSFSSYQTKRAGGARLIPKRNSWPNIRHESSALVWSSQAWSFSSLSMKEDLGIVMQRSLDVGLRRFRSADIARHKWHQKPGDHKWPNSKLHCIVLLGLSSPFWIGSCCHSTFPFRLAWSFSSERSNTSQTFLEDLQKVGRVVITGTDFARRFVAARKRGREKGHVGLIFTH